MGKWRIRRRRNRRKWKRMLIHVDSNDFVVSVEREESERRNGRMPETTRICRGPWHYKGGKGTLLPISMFPENRYKAGTLTKTCGECLNKSGKRSAIPLGVRPMESMPTPVRFEGNPVLPTPVLENGGPQHKWEVTITRTEVVILYAKDYSDAGKQAGEGDVTNVRRLD